MNVVDLEAVAAISRLKYTYLRALDTKCWDEFADTLLPDVTASYGEDLAFDSRDALVEFMKSSLGPQTITEHHCGHPEIDVEGDTATGRWYLSDTVLIPERGIALCGAAFYSDRYTRGTDGRWRIAHTGYERTYEAMMSLSDMPSFRLTSNRMAAESDSGNGAV